MPGKMFASAFSSREPRTVVEEEKRRRSRSKSRERKFLSSDGSVRSKSRDRSVRGFFSSNSSVTSSTSTKKSRSSNRSVGGGSVKSGRSGRSGRSGMSQIDDRSVASNSSSRKGWTRVVPPSGDVSVVSQGDFSQSYRSARSNAVSNYQPSSSMKYQMPDFIDCSSQITKMTAPSSNGGNSTRYDSHRSLQSSLPSINPSMGDTRSVSVTDTRSVMSYGSGSTEAKSEKSAATVATAMLQAMDSDKFVDITLVGRQGVRVPAAKFVLASRCEGLQKILYSDLTTLEVKIGDYGELTLVAMKEYCHACDLSKVTGVKGKKNEVVVKTLVELCDLANNYNFESLYNDAMHTLLPVLESSPWFMAAAYDAAESPSSAKIEQYALRFMESRDFDLLLETDAMKYVRPTRIEKFLARINVEIIAKIQILEKWLEKHGPHKAPNRKIVDNFCSGIDLEALILKNIEANAKILREFGFWEDEKIDRIVEKNQPPPEETPTDVKNKLQLQAGFEHAVAVEITPVDIRNEDPRQQMLEKLEMKAPPPPLVQKPASRRGPDEGLSSMRSNSVKRLQARAQEEKIRGMISNLSTSK